MDRLKDQGETKREVKELEERVESLNAELRIEKEKNVKKASRDLAEVFLPSIFINTTIFF